MDTKDALAALAALGQPTRLDVFRRLVSHEPEGMVAGTLAEALGVPPNTLSAHLAVLVQAGLASSQRQGRFVIYRAELTRLGGLLAFLVEDCCGGRPEVCVPPSSRASPPCSPITRPKHEFCP